MCKVKSAEGQQLSSTALTACAVQGLRRGTRNTGNAENEGQIEREEGGLSR